MPFSAAAASARERRGEETYAGGWAADVASGGSELLGTGRGGYEDRGVSLGRGGGVESGRMEIPYIEHWRYLLVALSVYVIVQGIAVYTEGVYLYRPGLVREEIVLTFNVVPVCL